MITCIHSIVLNFIEHSIKEHPLPWRTNGVRVIASDDFLVLECGNEDEAAAAITYAEYVAC